MLIAFDPGITTGWARYNLGEFQVGEIDSIDLSHIYNFINSNYLDCWDHFDIGYEDFKHRPQLINTEMYSLQVIGAIRLWSHLHINEYEPFRYLPATAKAFWKDEKIKALGLWKPGKPHAMDALRVLLKYKMDTDREWFSEAVEKLK